MTHGSPRAWNERDHPRDGEGRFTDKTGDWASRISDAIGGVQGRPLPGGFPDRQTTPSSVRDALARKVHNDPRLSSRISDADMAQLSDGILDEVIDQANDDYLSLDDPTLTFREYVIDQLAEQLRRFSPDELWPHHF